MTLGQDNIVCIATRHELDGPGIELRWKREFPHSSRRALGPTQPPVQRVLGLYPEVKRPWRGVDQRPLSSAVSQRKSGVYLSSPFGLYGPFILTVKVTDHQTV